jgi:hypothetical protein
MSNDNNAIFSEINELLKPYYLGYGIRTKKEIALYLSKYIELNSNNGDAIQDDDLKKQVDFMLMTKVLPKIKGDENSKKMLKEIIEITQKYFLGENNKLKYKDKDNDNSEKEFPNFDWSDKSNLDNIDDIKNNKSLYRLLEMYRECELYNTFQFAR